MAFSLIAISLLGSPQRRSVQRCGRSPDCSALLERFSHSEAPSLLLVRRLRGGVRYLEAGEWEAVLEEAGDSLVVLDFTATWCGPCQRIAPAFDAMAKEMPHVRFLKVDVDELGELAAEMGVTSMPTFLFFRNGESIAQLRGADEGRLRALVTEHST